MSTSIVIAGNDRLRQQAFALRYNVYVELQRRTALRYVNHPERKIEEPLDKVATIFVALDGDKVIGTIRHNWLAEDESLGSEFYNAEIVDEYLSQTSVTSKLIVAESHRNSNAAIRLARATFQFGRGRGCLFDFINCNPAHGLKPFYEKLGYRQIMPNKVHLEFGEAIPMLLVLEDRAHLTSVGSPFLKLLVDYSPDERSVQFFYSSVLARAARYWL